MVMLLLTTSLLILGARMTTGNPSRVWAVKAGEGEEMHMKTREKTAKQQEGIETSGRN